MRTTALRLVGALALAAGVLVPLTASGSTNAVSPTCSWLAKSDPDTVNVAYPDTNATYWSHAYVGAPGTELLVHGTYPKARYFSFHAYQPSGVPIDSIYDANIRPDKGSSNPYAGGSARGGTYTVHVLFTPKPAHPAVNTVYAGQQKLGNLKNPGGLFMMRVYVPVDHSSPAGGVPLPTIDLATTAGTSLVEGKACSVDPPSRNGLGTNALNGASQPSTVQVPGGITWSRAAGNEAFGFFGNQQNAYLTAAVNRVYGDLVVIRGKAPAFPNTSRGTLPSSKDQVRYWSMCQNSNSTRVNACTADYQTAVDKQGYYTIVISDPSRRPTNATAAHGVTWLPWGAADVTGTLIYRNMVPSKTFTHAAQDVAAKADPTKVMAAYYPAGRYCTKEHFEHGGWDGCLE